MWMEIDVHLWKSREITDPFLGKFMQSLFVRNVSEESIVPQERGFTGLRGFHGASPKFVTSQTALCPTTLDTNTSDLKFKSVRISILKLLSKFDWLASCFTQSDLETGKGSNRRPHHVRLLDREWWLPVKYVAIIPEWAVVLSWFRAQNLAIF